MKTKKITTSLVRSLILPRKKESHKGDYGHVLVLAGSKNMTGAAVLCTNGALRSGAGLVTLGTAGSVVSLIAKQLRPEAMAFALEEKKGLLSYKAAQQVLEFVKKKKVSVVAIGPGLGQNSGISKFVKKIISSVSVPVVVDADGLNALKAVDLKKAKAKIIITPHPGEMSRLSGLTIEKIQKSREITALKFARENGVVCVLKGAGSLVTDGKSIFVNITGNPGMAKGGSGDVLTGMIAALVSQVREPLLLNAAVCGAFLHGLAGDIAAKAKTAQSMLAGDISEALPGAFRKTLNKS